MKALIRTRDKFDPKLMREVENYSKGIADSQADDIAARVVNEMVRAMYDCDISKEKIQEVVHYHNEAIAPKYAEYRTTKDGDEAQQIFCAEHELPYSVCVHSRI